MALTWNELAGAPAGLNGRTSIAVANNTNAQRIFLVANNGLFRSDDGGATWRQMDAGDTRIRNGQGGYNCGVYVDPKNPDIVYVLSTSSYRSLDGGNTFTGFKGAPGGDDPQQMWIDPTDGKRMFLGVDQGATVSLDGGESWSPWYNQATAQVYHISVDNSYPYWVYATQQDAGAIATRSRGDLGAITPFDWYPTAGYEFGSIVADPLNPKIVYSGGPAAGIVKITYPSGQWINVSPNLDATAGLRKVGNQPLIWSATNPHELLAGFQFLMATTDGGMHWKKLSPDLGYPKGVTPPPVTTGGRGGRGAGGATGAPPGGSIESISPSSVAAGVIWVGTNNGLVKLTRNHGVTWDDVTIPGLPNPTRADIQAIDASHQDPATAYVAIDYHVIGDYTPYFYRTHDYGRTWTKIINGMRTDQPSGSFARVIRTDTRKPGLLFAGTESSVYVSFNDGDDWQSLMLNLPNTSYRDMVIKDNDLVVGTYGRSFWVLDDISPLRQITPAIPSEPAHLFKPGDAIRVRRNVGGDTPFPPEVPHAENPPLGAIIYYFLGSRPAGEITLDISDAAGKAVRHLSSAPIPARTEPPPSVPDFWLEKPRPMPADIGMHRINWNLRYDDPPTFTHNYEINANPGETPASPEGPLVLPGDVHGEADRRRQELHADIQRQERSAFTGVGCQPHRSTCLAGQPVWRGTGSVGGVPTSRRDACSRRGDRSRQSAHRMSRPRLAPSTRRWHAWVAPAAADGAVGVAAGRGAAGPAAPPNFAALVGTMNRQLGTLDAGDMAPSEVMHTIATAACGDLRTALMRWQEITEKPLADFNALLSRNGIKAVPAPGMTPAAPACATRAATPRRADATGRKPGQ